MKNKYLKFACIALFTFFFASSFSQRLPKIIGDKKVASKNYLPDFSYAGYQFGEKEIPKNTGKIILASDYGVIANDGLDDSKNLIKALTACKKMSGNIVLQLPKGRIIISEFIYIERSNFVLRGAGTGINGTEIYFPRPLMYVKNPEDLQELREYLLKFDKRQREKENNIDLPFSQYAWAGGFIWTRVPKVRVKSYLKKYEKPYNVLAEVKKGKRGSHTFYVLNTKNLKKGDVVLLQLFNKNGEKGKVS